MRTNPKSFYLAWGHEDIEIYQPSRNQSESMKKVQTMAITKNIKILTQ